MEKENYIEKIENIMAESVYPTSDNSSVYIWYDTIDDEDKDVIPIIEKIVNLVNNNHSLKDMEISDLIEMVK